MFAWSRPGDATDKDTLRITAEITEVAGTEMEATETQPQSDMETRTFPQMAEVQTENEEELTSPPDPADKETGIHMEDDDARITGDVLVPDSVQSVSEEESGADHIPGETVMPVTDVVPEDAINAEDEICKDKSEKNLELDTLGYCLYLQIS